MFALRQRPCGTQQRWPVVKTQVCDERRDVCTACREQLRRTEGKKEFVFYDGPPFATGLPHYGHILAGSIKVCSESQALCCHMPAWLGQCNPPTSTCALQDIVTRYASQTGRHVVRRFGWDCHGLPVEYEIDKKLGEF